MERVSIRKEKVWKDFNFFLGSYFLINLLNAFTKSENLKNKSLQES